MTNRLQVRGLRSLLASCALAVAGLFTVLVWPLDAVEDGASSKSELTKLVEVADGTRLETGVSRVGDVTFLNRDYQMQEVPAELIGKPRYVFDGGSGISIRLKFRQPTVLFAAFEYNASGAWSLRMVAASHGSGWHPGGRLRTGEASNGEKNGKPHLQTSGFANSRRTGAD